ncbi:MAG: hypothetical protein COA62_07415 [Rhodobiaceae bacterium]|nr:MAG: hypothetical protein COA62_07415 [Rhodobiaceae bacterium]
MPTTSEIIRALIGSWKIARRDPTALAGFDFSADAFWRSFAAYIFVIPFCLVFITTQWRMMADTAQMLGVSQSGYALIELATYVAFWVLYPIAMIFACRVFNLTRGFAPYIIVYNWSSILVMVLLAPSYVLYSLGVANVGAASFLLLIAFVTALIYRWQIALTVLATTPATAASIIGVELALAFAINFVASAFLQIGG